MVCSIRMDRVLSVSVVDPDVSPFVGDLGEDGVLLVVFVGDFVTTEVAVVVVGVVVVDVLVVNFGLDMDADNMELSGGSSDFVLDKVISPDGDDDEDGMLLLLLLFDVNDDNDEEDDILFDEGGDFVFGDDDETDCGFLFVITGVVIPLFRIVVLPS